MTLTALSKRCKHLEPRSSSRREKARLGSLHLVTVIVTPPISTNAAPRSGSPAAGRGRFPDGFRRGGVRRVARGGNVSGLWGRDRCRPDRGVFRHFPQTCGRSATCLPAVAMPRCSAKRFPLCKPNPALETLCFRPPVGVLNSGTPLPETLQESTGNNLPPTRRLRGRAGKGRE